jgi:4-amino-4-deoxy-L-arabinose transferase-like glycosyltransferase
LVQESQNTKRDALGDLLALTILWLIAAIIVNPRGNFPLNDDWVYGWPVKVFLDSGRFEILSWTGVSLIGHVIWGLLFCSILGFSFTVLRISMLLLGLVGVLTTYHVFKLAGADRRMAFLAALIVGFNPIYYELSFTFMTDISFLAFVLLTLLLLFKFLENDRLSFLIGATVAATFSTLIRDVGVLLPAIFGVVLVLGNGLNKRTLARAPIPLAFALGAYVLYRSLVATTVGSPSIYDAKVRAILNVLDGGVDGLLLIVDRFHHSVMYLGLFLAPFIVVQFTALWRKYDARRRGWWWSVAVCSAVFLTWRMFALGKMMPLSKNVLFNFGLGPPTLRDVGLLHIPNYYTAPKFLWFAVTIVALAGACVALGFFAVETYEGIRKRVWKTNDPGSAQLALVIGVVIGYLGLISLSGLFDRYLIFLIPFCLLALHFWAPTHKQGVGKTAVAVSAILMIFPAVFAVGATHDYLSWNRARWAAINHLTKDQKVSPQRIDGGVEFNGWFLYDKNYAREKDKSWWWVVDDEFIVSFGPLPGYEVEESYPFTRIMPPGRAAVLILRRSAADTLSDSGGSIAERNDPAGSLPER